MDFLRLRGGKFVCVCFPSPKGFVEGFVEDLGQLRLFSPKLRRLSSRRENLKTSCECGDCWKVRWASNHAESARNFWRRVRASERLKLFADHDSVMSSVPFYSLLEQSLPKEKPQSSPRRRRRAKKNSTNTQKTFPRFVELQHRILHISAMEIDAVENEIYYFISSSDSALLCSVVFKNLICSFKVFFNCYRETFPIPMSERRFLSV